MNFFGVLTLIGGIALFLFGMQVMSDGLKTISGGKLEHILQTLTSAKWKAVLLGLGVTALVQSSSATTVMVVGLVNSGLMQLGQAVNIILGANIGTTATAWLLSLSSIDSTNVLIQMFKPSSFSPVFAIVGVFMMMFSKSEKKRGIGSFLLGFAVLMFGMDTMSRATQPLQNNREFAKTLTMFSNPFLGAIAGLIPTMLIHSSGATIGILQALSMSGTVTIGTVLPILMGENLGTAVTAVLASIGTSRNAKRTALMHIDFCLIKTTTFMVVFYTVNAFVHFQFLNDIANPLLIAIIHTIFNVASVLLILPFSDALVKLAVKTLPITPEEQEKADQIKLLPKLDTRFYSSPAIALDACRVEACKMGRYAEETLKTAMDLLENYTPEGFGRVERLEQLIDQYDDQLEGYLTSLSLNITSQSESRALSSILHSVGNFERISDHSLNIAQSAGEKVESGRGMPKKPQEVLTVFGRAVLNITHTAVQSFCRDDPALAKTVEPLEEVIDGLDMEIKRRIRRMKRGKGNVKMGFVLSDVATDYERVADHCSNIAVAVLQEYAEAGGAHEYLNTVKSAENSEFRAEVAHFRAEYAIPEADPNSPELPEPEHEKDSGKRKEKKQKKAVRETAG